MTVAQPLSRRGVVLGAAALALPASVLAQASSTPTAATPAALVGPLAPNPVAFRKAMADFTRGATPSTDGLKLDVPMLADNPSAVPVKVKVTAPITEQDWCEEIIVVAELNPIPLACRIKFTADTGTAEAAVRIRLSQSQNVHVLARMKNGAVLQGKQMVTVAASGCGM